MSKRKKRLCILAVVVLLLVCMAAFFRPLSLSNLVGQNSQIQMVLSEFGVRNGEPYNDSTNYMEITVEQTRAILSILDKATYRRTFGSLFSNGTISGDKILNIYIYDGESLVGGILVSSSGSIAVNGKTYSMKHAERFMEQIIEIAEQKD